MSYRRRQPRHRSVAVLILAAAAIACTDSVTVVSDPLLPPPGADATAPFPLDRGDDGSHTPGTYKGLWLRLVDNGAPQGVDPVDGVLGVVCVGMSNGRQECDRLIAGVAGEWADEVRPEVRIVNCAVGGHAIEKWIDPAHDERLWEACIERALPAAGVRVDQVRVLLHKAANQFTTGPGGAPLPTYPDPASDFAAFERHLGSFAARVPTWFPAVRAVYTSSRSYGGFANKASRGEPLSYEEGHALNGWLEANPSVAGVWYGWGAYLWAGACGAGEPNGAGLCYERGDFKTDGVHPTAAGEAKIAELAHERLSEHAWYRR